MLLFLGIILCSGCSLAPASDKSSGVKTFTLSQSVWKSTDGGKTWEAKTKGEGAANIKDIDVLSLAINPADSNNIFVGLRKGGILESKNGGETWQFLKDFTSEKVYGLAISPADGKTLYASGVWQGRGKIFKSPDLGGSWKEIYTSPSNGPLVIAMALDKNNPNTVYAATSTNEALKSSDGGNSWKNIYLASSPILKIALDAKNSNLIYFVTDRGELFRSLDGGNNFENISDKIKNSLKSLFNFKFNILEADPSVSSRVYVGGESGLLSSLDNGETWKNIPTLNDPKDFPVRAMAVNPQNSNEIIYGAAQSTCQSSDGGNNWTTFQFNTKASIKDILYSPSNAGVIYLGLTK